MEHLILASVGSVILLTGLAFTFGDIASTAAGIINLVYPLWLLFLPSSFFSLFLFSFLFFADANRL